MFPTRTRSTWMTSGYALAVAICHLNRARRPAPASALGAATRSLETLLARRVRKP